MLEIILFLVVLGFFGLFFYKNSTKRLISLLISYIGFLAFVLLVVSEAYLFLVILVIFLVNFWMLYCLFLRLGRVSGVGGLW